MKKAIVPMGIIILFVFGIFMYFNRFTIFHVSDVDGYVFNNDDIATNLSAGVDEGSPKITFENVKISDNIYKSGKKYYIGEETKKNVVLNYPIVSSDDSSLLILNDTGFYVEETFVKTTTYPNTIITEGSLYNGINNTRVDEAKYIFVDLGNGIYVNLLDVEITTSDGTTTIPNHSFIYFERSFLRYYYYSNGIYKYKEIAGIRDYSDFVVGDYTYDYYDFLIFLGVLERPDLKDEEFADVTAPEISGTGAGNISAGTTTDSIQLPPPLIESTGAHFVDKEYVKPEVKFGNTSVGVYSWSGDLEIKDPADRIFKAPTFEFKVNGTVKMRRTFTRTMRAETVGLLPDTEYEVYAYYQYLNHLDQKMEVKIFEGRFKTKNTSELEPLKMEIGDVIASVKAAEIKDIILKNDPNCESLKGIADGKIQFDKKLMLSLDYSVINELSNLKSTNFTTGDSFSSGTDYTGTIIIYDVAGNEMPIIGNVFSFQTLKTPPIGTLGVDDMNRNFTTARIRLTLNNPDDIEDDPESYRFHVYDDTGQLVFSKKLTEPSTVNRSEVITVNNLRPKKIYTVKMFCNYKDAVSGWVYDYELASKEMFTADYAILGSIPINVEIKDEYITSAGANVSIQFPEYDISDPLYEFMNDNIPVTIYNKNDPQERIQLSFSAFQYIQGLGSIEFAISQDCEVSSNECIKTELSSNTEYVVEVKPYIYINAFENYQIPTRQNNDEFITKKQDVRIHYFNGYIADGYVDFDLCIEDKDGVLDVKEDGVYEPKKIKFDFVPEGTDDIADYHYIQPSKSCAIITQNNESTDSGESNRPGESGEQTGKDEQNKVSSDAYQNFTRITTKNLDSLKEYSVVYRFEEYNYTREKSNIQNDEEDRILMTNLVPQGSYGDLKLIELTNQVNYNIERATDPQTTQSNLVEDVNLFDISNNSRWIYHGENEVTGDTKELRLDESEIVFTTTESSGYKVFSYYIPELKNQDYYITFESSLPSGAKALINTIDNFENDTGTSNYSIPISTTEDEKLVPNKVSIKVCKTQAEGCHLYQTGKYISFYIKPKTGGAKTEWKIKNLKINLGQNASNQYSGFGKKTADQEGFVNSYAGKFEVLFNNVVQKTEETVNEFKEKELEDFFDKGWKYNYYIEYKVDGKITTKYLITDEKLNEIELEDDEEGSTQEGEGESSEEIVKTLAQTLEDFKDGEKIIQEELIANKAFTSTIGVEIEYNNGHIKKHILGTLDFSTETETRTIKNRTDFINMHPYGYYYLDLTNPDETPITCKLDTGELYSVDQQAANPCINLSGLQYEQTFQGSIDFQGYDVQLDVQTTGTTTEEVSKKNALFVTLGGGAKIRNLNLAIRFYTNEEWNSQLPYYAAIAQINNGLISNVKITYDSPRGFYQPRTVVTAVKSEESLVYVPKYYRDTGHSNFSLITNENNGTIENFAIELKEDIPILTNSGLVTITNNGIIRNGYMTGRHIMSGYRVTSGTAKNIGVLATTTTANSTIANIYSTIEVITKEPIYTDEEKKKDCPSHLVTCDADYQKLDNESTLGVLVDEETGATTSYIMTTSDKKAASLVHKATNAFIKNAIVLDSRVLPPDTKNQYYYNFENDRNVDNDFIITERSNTTPENIFYIGNLSTKKLVSAKKIDQDVLKSETFMIQTLNEEGKFDTGYAWSNRELPQLIWPDCMPKQLNIGLASAIETKRLDIVAVSKTIQMSEYSTNTYLQEIAKTYSLNPADWFAIVEIGLLNPDNYFDIKGMKIDGISDVVKNEQGVHEFTNIKVLEQPEANNSGMTNILIAIGKPNKYKQKYTLKEIIVKNPIQSTEMPYLCEYESTDSYDTPKTGTCSSQPSLELDLYREVTSFKDYNTAIGEGHTNFRLMADLIIDPNFYIKDKSANSVVFSGVLDGNGHYIMTKDKKNGELVTKNCLIKQLSGTIKNINIKKHIVEPQKTSTNLYSGLVCESMTGSVIDNVHIENVETGVATTATDAELYLGGLIGYSNNAIVSNSSVSNMEIDDDLLAGVGSQKGNLNIGGIAGGGSLNITNTFVRHINFDLKSYTPAPAGGKATPGYEGLTSAGGIVGDFTAGNIENTYATGIINSGLGSATKGIGGITGYTKGFIRNAISKVGIYANSDTIGGITGGTVQNSSYLSNTLVFGDILTLMDEGKYSAVDRTSGTLISKNQNYAWYYQSKNSEVTPNTTLEDLIESDEFKNPALFETKLGLNPKDFAIELSNYKLLVVDDKNNSHIILSTQIEEESDGNGGVTRFFRYNDTQVVIVKEYATLPILKHSETGEVLNNQEFEIDPLTNDENKKGDYIISYVPTFSITSTPVIQYTKKDPSQANGEGKTTKEYAEYVKVSFYMEITDPNINTEVPLHFGITDMVPYCEANDNECAKSNYISIIPTPTPELPIGSGCTNQNYCYHVALNVKAAENKNYVNYTVSEIKYKPKDADDLSIYRTKIKLKIPFYGRIDDVCDWQKIMYGTYQNFSIVGDIDFSSDALNKCESGISRTPNINLSFENLVGVPNEKNEYPTIKNLTITEQPHGTSLIKNVNSEIKGINFKDITIKAKSTSSEGNNLGIIHTLKGSMYGHTPGNTSDADVYMHFEDIELYGNKTNKVGIIANSQSPLIEYIKLKNVKVTGLDKSGGFIAESASAKNKYDIFAENIKVSGRKYVGGIVAYEPYYGWTRFNLRMQINGVNINGTSDYVGGAFGYGAGDYITVTGKSKDDLTTTDINESEYNIVTGKYRTGGMSGGIGNHGTVYTITKNLKITGTYYVGGVFGENAYCTYAQSILNTVKGTHRVGGIAGTEGSSIFKAVVAGNSIEGTHATDTRVGGIIGYHGWGDVNDNQVGTYEDDAGNKVYTTITGKRSVGGIAGWVHQGSKLYRNIVTADIEGEVYVGGLIGLADNTSNSTTQPNHTIQNNVVANARVKATKTVSSTDYKYDNYYFAGGLIGRVYKRLNNTLNKNNLVAATILAGNGTTSPSTLNGVGYVVGGSGYFHQFKSWVTETITDENGEPKKVSVQKNIPYNFTQPYGDIFVGPSTLGGVDGKTTGFDSGMPGTRVYEGTTINNIPITSAKTDVNKAVYDKVIYDSESNKTGNIKMITLSDLKNLDKYKLDGTNQYFAKSSFDKDANNKPNANDKLTYYPYQNAGGTTAKAHYIFKEENLPKSVFTRVNQEITRTRIDDNLPGENSQLDYKNHTVSSVTGNVPSFNVYPVAADKINIEFNQIDLRSFFTLNDQRYQINKLVYTFYYDFKDDFVIEVTNNVEDKKITIKADEIKNGVSVIGDYYYYLDDNGEIVTNNPAETNENKKEKIEQKPVEKPEEETSSGESIGNIENDSDVIVEKEENIEVSQPAQEENQIAYVSPGLSLLDLNSRNAFQNKLEKENETKVIDKATNIYNGKVLLENQDIYDLETGETKPNSFENLTPAETTSLYEFDYAGSEILTYKNYSVINGQVIKKQIFVKNGQIEVIEQQGLNNSTNQIIMDNYNDQNFLLYLGTDGKIHCLKDEIKYPRNFKNINIKSISTNVTNDTNILFVEYQNGNYLAFNYVTGQLITKNDSEPMGLIDYIKQELQLSGDNLSKKTTNESYEKAKKLVSELNKKSIDQVLRGDNNSDTPELYSRKYSIAYDPTSGDYYVYEIPTKSGVSNDDKSLVENLSTSVDSIIDNNPKLVKYYRGENYSKVNKVSAFMITIGIIMGIVLSTIGLGKYMKKRKKINE